MSAITHAFSQSIVDAVGTVTIFNSQGSTQTIAATDLIGASDWNSGHAQLATLAGNTAGVSSLSGTNIVIAGGNNLTVSGIQGANAATVSLIGATAAAAPVNFSAGTTSGDLGSVVFSNSNNIQFGLNGSTITAIARVGVSAGTTSGFFSVVTFSNSNNVSFGLSNGIVTATATNAINLSAGTTSNNLAAAVFSNSNNVSFGLNGSTITASVAAGAGNTISYLANYEALGSTGAGANTIGAVTTQFTNGSSFIAPVVIPANLSVGFLRLIATGSGGAAASNSSLGTATTATTITAEIRSTLAAGLFVQNTGASSLSLTRALSATGGSTIAWALNANSNGSEYSVTAAASFPVLMGTSSFSASYASTRSRYDFHTSVFSNFTGHVGLDFPFAISAAQSNYWLAVGVSSVTSGTNLARVSFNPFISLGEAHPIANMGQTAAPPDGVRLGQGAFTSNAPGIPAALAFSAISSNASDGVLPFQMIRLA